jgi:peptide/nickel transport system substrate-binding protein
MKNRLQTVLLALFVAGLALSLTATTALAQKKTRVTIGVTETMETHNPYGDSVALLYGIYTELAGPLCKYDWKNEKWVPRLAKSWTVEDPNTWVFKLDERYTFQDGSPVTADDVVHSFWRVFNDPQTKQIASVARPVKEATAIDKFTVRVTTRKPTAPLLDFLCDALIITSKKIFDKHGRKKADREFHYGGGPYELVELVPGQRMVTRKRPDHPQSMDNPKAPDEVVFRVMREPEQRVAALLNNEVQIAQLIPPHLLKTVDSSPKHKIVKVDSVVLMFLAMQPKPPFDKKEVRQAVCYAIDRDKIIKTLLQGQARRLDGPLGPGQLGYNPNLKTRYTYDPKKARELLAKAGYPDGVEVELQTPVNRYILDKQATEAMIPMLNAAGFKAKLRTPEWPTLWANVQKGKVPFFYMGRGGVLDPSSAFHQYFRKGGSPRIGFSHPDLDAALDAEQQEFDPAKRNEHLTTAMELITDLAPACFQWRHQFLWGLANNIDYQPPADSRIYGMDISVK